MYKERDKNQIPQCKKGHFIDKRLGDPITKIVESKIKKWKSGELLEDAERVIVIKGWPGIGKTAFLRWVKEEHGGIFLDLEERQRYSTPIAYLNQVKKTLEEARSSNSPGLLLCVDTVPGAGKRDPYLKELEEKVLAPELEDENAFLVLARQHPRNWCLVKIPHTSPLHIQCLTLDGLRELLREKECRDGAIVEEIFDCSTGHPELSLLLWECKITGEDCAQAVKAFLEGWLDRVERYGFGVDRRRLQKVAKPLSTVLTLSNSKKVADALSTAGIRMRPFEALNVLRVAWWVEDIPSGSQGRYVPQWVEPIRRCLVCEC